MKYEEDGDYEKALELYKEASAEGNVYGQFNVGRYYLKKLPEMALNYFQRAANQNLADAQYNLGVMLSAGIGVVFNADDAISWWLKAGRQGNIESVTALGLQDEKGHAKLMMNKSPIDVVFSKFEDVINVDKQIMIFSDQFNKKRIMPEEQRNAIIGTTSKECSADIEYVEKSVHNNNYSQFIGITSWHNCYIQAEKLLFE